MSEKRIAFIIAAVAAIAAITGIINSPEPKVLTVSHTVSMGIVSSAIFYFIFVWVPTRIQRQRIRRYIQRQYDDFKSACILEFLIASNSQDYPWKSREALREPDEFYRYFSTFISHDQERWHLVMDKLHDNNYGTLKDVLCQLEILREVIIYVLNHVDIFDDDVLVFINRLSHVVLCNKDVGSGQEYYAVERIEGILWQIFTGWDSVKGFRGDIVKSMIDRI